MRIRKLTATFGCLDHDELPLQEGLNVITAYNEAGKSTWVAFLLAMFYGIDTAERATRTSQPARVRFRPWNGGNLEGSMELSWNGQDITIERTTAGRAPMGAFRACDSTTGRTLDFLNAENCGPTLIGVERSVWERSGFIRQQGLAVTGDAALETRLAALVTTGEEDVSYSLTQRRLRELRNRRRYNKTGLLPQAEEELAAVEDKLRAIRADGEESMRLRARQEALAAEQAGLRRLLDIRGRLQTEQKRLQLEQARRDCEKAARSLEEKQAAAAGLPALERLQELQRQLDLLSEAGRALDTDQVMGVERPKEPDCPPAFAGLSPDGVRQQAEEDCKRLEELQRPLPRKSGLWIAAALAAAAALGVFHVSPSAGAGLLLAAAVLAVLAGGGMLRRRKRKAQRAQEAQAVLQKYGALDLCDIRRAADDRREAMLLYAQKCAAVDERLSQLTHRKAALDERRAELLEQIRAFCPGCDSPEAARAALQQAVYRQQFCAAAQRGVQQARAKYEAVQAAVGPLPEFPEQPLPELPDGAPDPAQAAARLEAADRELRELRSRLDLRRGRMEAAGDPAALAARKEQLTLRVDRLQREYDALGLALDALEQANAELQTRFSPRLNALAGQLAAQMTGRRYDKVLLSQDMSVLAHPSGDTVTRPLPSLSSGTADQLYLAVRLAIGKLVLGAQTPLVLDDALVNFDDERMAAALELLRGESHSRQILLFTCHSREKSWLAAHPSD